MLIRPGRAKLGLNTAGCTDSSCKYVLGNLLTGTTLSIPVRQGAEYGLAGASLAIAAITLLAF